LVLIEADGDEFPMNFAAFITNLKSDLMRFYAKESVLKKRTSESSVQAKFAEFHASWHWRCFYVRQGTGTGGLFRDREARIR
jgi:hypothetical protein